MKIADIKEHLKKDPPGSLSIFIHRKIGLYLTWLILKIFPNINPNLLTLSMLLLDSTSALLVSISILYSNVKLLFLAYSVQFVSLSIDCADGNVARVTRKQSIKGVFYDRLVHNIGHPVLFCFIGYSVFIKTGNVYIMMVFIISGIFTELSPVTVAILQVKVMFLDQLLLNKRKTYDINQHSRGNSFDAPTKEKDNQQLNFMSLFNRIIRVILSIEVLFMIVFVEIFFLQDTYIVAMIFACASFLAKFAYSIHKYDLESFLSVIKSINGSVDH